MFLAILAGLGALLGFGKMISDAQRQKEADRLQLEKDILGLKGDIAGLTAQLGTTQTGIAETRFGISSMELALERYPAYAALEQSKFEASGEQTYRELMGNYGTINALAGATGRVAAGSSVAAVGQEARSDVAGFVGEDLTFDTEGGMYGAGWSELLKNLEAERLSYEGQLDVYKTSLDTLLETETTLEETLTESETQLEDWERELEEMTKPAPTTTEVPDHATGHDFR